MHLALAQEHQVARLKGITVALHGELGIAEMKAVYFMGIAVDMHGIVALRGPFAAETSAVDSHLHAVTFLSPF